MIKFFRKIRQNLLSENKFSKYMLYALGEIVLVVIGILLALQINTWNENKKANKLEIEMLLELKAGLETDAEALQRDFNNIKELYESRMTIINWIESKKPFSDSLSVHMSKIFFKQGFVYQVSVYETLKNMGLRKIKNDELRKQIAYLYDMAYPSHARTRNTYGKAIDELMSTGILHINEFSYYNLTVTKPNDVGKLRADNKFLAQLKTIKNIDQLMIDHVLKGLHEYIIKTIKMINEEIELRTGESIEKKEYKKLFNSREVVTDLIGIGQLLREDKKTVDEIIQLIKTQDSKKPVYDTTEVNINTVGYTLMQVARVKDALKIFELNIELHPDSYRAYDSYGQCLLKLGDTTKAIKAYEKSVELNPDNQNGIEVLSKLK